MLQEDKQILWRASAVCLGAALPTMIFGKAVMFVLLGLGMIAGLAATKDESLRATVRLMLDSWFTLLSVLLLAVMLVGVWTGVNPHFAFDKWLQLIVVFLCSGALFMTLREMPGRHVELLLKVLTSSVLAAAALALVDALAGDPRLSAALHGADKALTPYRLNFMSSALAVTLPFVWARLMQKAREGEAFAQRIALPASVFSVIVALVCGGRAGWAGLFAALFVFISLAGRYHSLVLHARHYLGGLIALGVGVVLYGWCFGWDFMMNRVTIVGEQGVGRGMLSGRLDVWEFALRHVLDHPFFGIGVMNYRNLPMAADLHPHNWVLQMLLETGVFGTAIFVVMMLLLCQRFFRFAKGNIFGVAALASLLAFLISGLANTSIFNAWWLAYLVFSCVLGWRAGWGGEDLKKRRRGRIYREREAA